MHEYILCVFDYVLQQFRSFLRSELGNRRFGFVSL